MSDEQSKQEQPQQQPAREQKPRRVLRPGDINWNPNDVPEQRLHVAPAKPTPDQLYKHLVDSGFVAAFDVTPASVAQHRYRTENAYAEAVDSILEHRKKLEGEKP